MATQMNCITGPAPASDDTSQGIDIAGFIDTVELPGEPVSVARAREHTAATLAAWRVGADTVETAVLLVSELVTNGVVHGCRCQATPIFNELARRPNLTLRLTLRGSRLLLEVFDPSLDPPFRPDGTPDDESGRGTLLLDALSETWDYRLLAFGKVVWCAVTAA
jgi:anti-sigma regulatory factor (Ser/Thr protein kinase)